MQNKSNDNHEEIEDYLWIKWNTTKVIIYVLIFNIK